MAVLLGCGAAAALYAAGSFAPPRPSARLVIPLDPPAPAPDLPEVVGPAGRPLVVIDAGHGGHDPGAISPSGIREKDVTLALARAIRDALVAGGRVRVALTRSDDSFLVLRERFEMARQLGANLFISVHADSAASPDAHGATIYTLSEVGSDTEADALADRENRVDIVHGVNLNGRREDVASILIDLAQRETMGTAADFAKLLHREAAPLVPFRPDYHRMAALAVLKAPDVPSILFESGYVSNAGDLAFIASPEGRARVAEGFAHAIQIHFAKRLAAR